MENNNEFSYNQGTQDTQSASNTQSVSNAQSAPNAQSTYQTAQQTSPYQSPYANYGYSGQANGSAYGQTGSYAYGQQYGQNAYNQQAYRQAMAQPQPQMNNQKKKKEKKPGGFGSTLAKCAAIAVVFGLVAGGIFTGVSYAGVKLLGISTEASADAVGTAGDKNSSGVKNDSSSQTPVSVDTTSTGVAKDLLDVSDIVDEVMPSIVAITNTSVVTYQSFFGGYQQYEAESRGSGIVISQDSDYLYIATNNHVVSGAETLSVQFYNDATVSGEIQGTFASNDLAVVKVALKDIDSDTLSLIRQITIGDSDSLKVGEGTIAIGNALGYGQSVTTGIVSALHRSITVQDETTGATTTCDNLIQTDAAINPGNSGGALLNAYGELIGINSAKYSDTDVEGIGYAIPITDAMEIINALIAGESLEKVQTAYLGIGGGDVYDDVAAAYGLPKGVYVKEVYEGSGAAEAGICQGDIISGIDGKEITSMTELQNALMDYSAGDTVTLTVWRMNNGYQSMEVSVTLSDASVLGSAQTGNSDSGNNSGNNSGNESNNNGRNNNGFGDFDFGFGW